MGDLLHRWEDVPLDNPIPLLHRKRVTGEKILVANVFLTKGCRVDLHHHESEQIAYVISGHVRWGIGAPGTPDRREFESRGGEVLVLPSNLPHEVEALEDTNILDMLSPPGPMGVDAHTD